MEWEKMPGVLRLLVSEPVEAAAVGALPGDPVAGHAPDVFLHAILADLESAPAGPAKGHLLIAAVADIGPGFPAPLKVALST